VGSITNPLTEIAREDARRTLMVALKAEADGFVARFGDAMLAYGRQRVVRRGAGPEREIRTGIGPIAVQRQKVRDRAPDAPPGARIRFTSNILPKWARRTRSPDALPPALYLRGVFTGDFQEAMSALLGVEAPNLSPGRPGLAWLDFLRLTKSSGQGRTTQQGSRGSPAAGGTNTTAGGAAISQPPLRLHLGRRGLPPGPDGARGRVHSRHHRSDAKRPQGTARLSCRRAGERAELAG